MFDVLKMSKNWILQALYQHVPTKRQLCSGRFIDRNIPFRAEVAWIDLHVEGCIQAAWFYLHRVVPMVAA